MSSFVMCAPPEVGAITTAPLISEWQNLREILSKQSVALSLLAPVPYNIGVSCLAHQGFIWKNRAYMSYEKKLSDHGMPFLLAWLKHHGFQILPQALGRDNAMPIPFAGSADCLVVEDTLYLGYGLQTGHHMANVLPSHFNAKLVDLCLTNPKLPNLIQVFCPLSCGRALVCESGFDASALRKIAADFEIIPVSETDAARGACSAVLLDDKIIIPTGCDDTANQLFEHDYEVIETDLTHFSKKGYGCRSLVAELIDSSLPYKA
jgi:N-dimethylarginine dimethylaminohydrolase